MAHLKNAALKRAVQKNIIRSAQNKLILTGHTFRDWIQTNGVNKTGWSRKSTA